MQVRFPARYAVDMRFAIRVATAAGAAFVIATLLQLPQGYWSVITALIVVQANLGGTVAAAQERAVGTVVGSVVGGVAAFLHPHTLLGTSVTLTVTVAALAFAAAGRPMLRIAPITAAILLVATASNGNTLDTAFDRIFEVLVGCVIGVITTLVVFPTTIDRDLAREARAIAGDIAKVLRGAPGRQPAPEAMRALLGAQEAIRRKLAAFEKAVADAKRAPGGRDAAEAGAALARALWRVRNDAVAVGRTLATSDAPRDLLGQVPDDMILAVADMLDDIAAGRSSAQGRSKVEARLAGLDAAVSRLRHGDESVDIGAAVPAMGVVFALRNLAGNVGDLADRLGEAQDAGD